jgi:hypothetical protein
MARQPSGPQAVTANRLADGRVVYLTAAGIWAEAFEEAATAAPAEAEALLDRARAGLARAEIVEPYLIEVEADRPAPRRYRELLRARGPSVRPDHGKQAGRP